MSRHYHDSDCVPYAVEGIEEKLGELLEVLERIADALDRERPTERAKEDAAFERTATYIRQHPPADAIGRVVPR